MQDKQKNGATPTPRKATCAHKNSLQLLQYSLFARKRRPAGSIPPASTRVGVLQASERSIARDIQDSAMCAQPYLPEHNCNTGVFAAVMAADYPAALKLARHLANNRRLFPASSMSAGSDVVSLMEVHMQFGRCVLVCAAAGMYLHFLARSHRGEIRLH